MPKQNKVGRPTKLSTNVVRKLTEALKLAMPVVKACEYAGISTSTYYEYCRNNKDFSYKMKQAEYYATNIARKTVIEQMKTDGRLALDFLKRKVKDEFSDNPKYENMVINEHVPEEELKKIDALIDRDLERLEPKSKK